MMLRGEKPLAHFADGAGCFPEAMARYLRMFDRHLATGRFIRREKVSPPNALRAYTLHRILFALPAEEWRIDSMLELMDDLDKGEWSRTHERREGELLGYTDEQNDWHIAQFPSREAE